MLHMLLLQRYVPRSAHMRLPHPPPPSTTDPPPSPTLPLPPPIILWTTHHWGWHVGAHYSPKLKHQEWERKQEQERKLAHQLPRGQCPLRQACRSWKTCGCTTARCPSRAACTLSGSSRRRRAWRGTLDPCWGQRADRRERRSARRCAVEVGVCAGVEVGVGRVDGGRGGVYGGRSGACVGSGVGGDVCGGW